MQPATQKRRHAKNSQETRGDLPAVQAFVLVPAHQIHRCAKTINDRQSLETPALLLPIEKNPTGCAIFAGAISLRVFPNHDKLTGLIIGQRFQQYGVNYAEMAVFAPMPSASVSTATAVKPGCFISMRIA